MFLHKIFITCEDSFLSSTDTTRGDGSWRHVQWWRNGLVAGL